MLEMSWYGAKSVSAPLGEAFHARRLVLRSSQVGAVPASQRARWNHRRRLGLALDLLTDHPLRNDHGQVEAGVTIDDASLAPSWRPPFINVRQR